MQAGPVAFLDKPFSDEQLLKNIGWNSESGIDNVKAWAADLIQRSESAIRSTRA